MDELIDGAVYAFAGVVIDMAWTTDAERMNIFQSYLDRVIDNLPDIAAFFIGGPDDQHHRLVFGMPQQVAADDTNPQVDFGENPDLVQEQLVAGVEVLLEKLAGLGCVDTSVMNAMYVLSQAQGEVIYELPGTPLVANNGPTH